ncbi:MAG: tail fiber domain-containing protein [Rhodothermales bacterium]
MYSFIQNGYASYRFALWGKAQGSSTQSYGLHATGTGASNQNFGAYGSATGGSQAYGVYGVASGASTNYAGYFFGNVYATGTVTQLSDSRFKRDITTISSETKSALLELKPLTYRFANVNELAAAGLPRASLADGVHYGLIAQEVQAVLPDLVSQEILAIPAEDLSTQDVPVQTLGVNYSELIPILIAVIQDQQAQIEALQAAVRGAGIDVPDATSGNN